MNRRYLSFLGLMIVDGKAKDMIGPFSKKADAVKACQDELANATPEQKFSTGVFPIELEEVTLPAESADEPSGDVSDEPTGGTGRLLAREQAEREQREQTERETGGSDDDSEDTGGEGGSSDQSGGSSSEGSDDAGDGK